MLFTRSRLSDEEKMAAAAYYYQQKTEKKAAKEANKEKVKKAKDKKKGEIIFHDFSEESKKAEAVYDKLQKAAEEEAVEIAAQKADESEAEPKAEEAAEHEKEKNPEEKREQTEPKAEEAKKPAEKPTPEETPPEPATEAPTEPAGAEKVEEPEIVNADAMKAAPEAGFNTGFKIDNFVQKPTPKPTPQQVTPAQVIGNFVRQPQPPQQHPIPQVQAQPVSVGGTPIVPPNATPSEKCDVIRASILASVGIAPVYDPKPDLTPKQKLNLIKKNISFMTGAKRQLDVIQLCGLIGLIEAPILKIRMEEYGAVDRTNNPKLVEIPIEPQEVQQGYDMKFSVKLKNKAETMFVLFSSVPDYNDTLKSWNHAIQIYKK